MKWYPRCSGARPLLQRQGVQCTRSLSLSEGHCLDCWFGESSLPTPPLYMLVNNMVVPRPRTATLWVIQLDIWPTYGMLYVMLRYNVAQVSTTPRT